MELQELKNQWTSVDEKLKKQEVLNTRMVEEVLKKKSKGALSWLMYREKRDITIAFVMILLAVLFLNNDFVSIFVFLPLLVIAGIAIYFTEIICGSYVLIKYLTKIDFSKNIHDNSLFIVKYKNFTRKYKMVEYIIFIPVTFLLLALFLYESNAGILWWVFSFVVLLMVTSFTVWFYKATEKDIKTIKESLAELNELEE